MTEPKPPDRKPTTQRRLASRQATTLELHLKVDRRAEGRALISVRGPIDAHTIKKVEKELDDLLSGGSSWIVLDLAALDYISSSGVLLILTTRGEARAAGGDLVIVKPRPPLVRIFDLIGLTEMLSWTTTVDEAWTLLKKARPVER